MNKEHRRCVRCSGALVSCFSILSNVVFMSGSNLNWCHQWSSTSTVSESHFKFQHLTGHFSNVDFCIVLLSVQPLKNYIFVAQCCSYSASSPAPLTVCNAFNALGGAQMADSTWFAHWSMRPCFAFVATTLFTYFICQSFVFQYLTFTKLQCVLTVLPDKHTHCGKHISCCMSWVLFSATCLVVSYAWLLHAFWHRGSVAALHGFSRFLHPDSLRL